MRDSYVKNTSIKLVWRIFFPPQELFNVYILAQLHSSTYYCFVSGAVQKNSM